MRPHVELIQEADLVWHEAELSRGSGKARQRNLSYDEECGSASTRIVFDKAWSRAAGYHHADVEWYVMEGAIKVGGRIIGKGGYLRAPAGPVHSGDGSCGRHRRAALPGIRRLGLFRFFKGSCPLRVPRRATRDPASAAS